MPLGWIVGWRFAAALIPRLFGNSIPGHTTRELPEGFELATDSIQFYVIANFDKTSRSNYIYNKND